MINKILSLFITILLLFLSWYFFIHIGLDYYLSKYIRHDEIFINDIYYQMKIENYYHLNELLDKDKTYYVFTGDSLIENFPIDELFPNYPVINRGIGMDTSYGLLTRLDKNLNNIKNHICFIMIGHNDLKYRSTSECFQYIVKIASILKYEKLYLFSILPDKNQENNKAIQQLNSTIKDFCHNNQIGFIDLYSSFINTDQSLIDEYYYKDGVHLSIKGYQVIQHKIKNLIFGNEPTQ